jgi:hypothetical protein
MTDFNISFPIDMIKKEQRLVSGIATADNIDKSNDIVDFEASKEAFANWGGNIREMHAPIAVGKAVKYEPVTITDKDGNTYNAFKVEAYISKGAEDTWQKVLDGTLRSFSIGGKVIKKEEMANKMHNGRPINVIKKYVLGELSLVDNPANALAVIDLVKMNNEGGLNYALDCDLDCQLAKAKQPLKDPKGGLTAAGRRHFKETEGANLKPGVRGAADTPEKMRRKGSFLTRFFTNPSGPMKKPNGEPTRLALSAAAWGEPVPQDMADAAKLAAKGRRLLERYQNTKEKADFEDSFEDAILEGILDLLEKDGCDCGCGTCEDVEKDGLGAGGGAPAVSVSTDNAESKYPSRNGIASPTVAPFPSGYPRFKPKKKKKKKESNMENEETVEKQMVDGDEITSILEDLLESLMEAGVEIPSVSAESEDSMDDEMEDEMEDENEIESSMNEIIMALAQLFGKSDSSEVIEDNQSETTPDVLNFDTIEEESKDMESVIKQDTELQANDNYDKISDMNEQEANKLSLLKKFVGWLFQDVKETTSTSVEVSGNTQEEEMDINILKDALSAVVDEKLASFATSIKEEVEASVQEKIEAVAKSFEVQSAELQQKLETAELALSEQTEKVEAFAAAGAVKKSVDPEDAEEEEGEALVKSAPASFWKNTYLPQELINSLGYRS